MACKITRLSYLGFFFQGYIKNNIWDIPKPQLITIRQLSASTVRECRNMPAVLIQNASFSSSLSSTQRLWPRVHVEDWLLKNRQNLACKILYVELYTSISYSVFNKIQQFWYQNLSWDMFYSKWKKFWQLNKRLLFYWSNARTFLEHPV